MFRSLFSSSSKTTSTSAGDYTAELRDLVQNMTRALVDDPSKIEIDQGEAEEGGLLFELKVSKPDLGKVIGKKGRTASAMRTILSAASRKHRVAADLKIVE